MNIFHRIFGAPVPAMGVAVVQEQLTLPKKPLLLDVRQPAEYVAGHIAGAILIPLGDLDKRMNELPQGREVVCICATGHRSVPAARKLIAAGYTASSMKQGMIAWRRAKLPVKKGKAR